MTDPRVTFSVCISSSEFLAIKCVPKRELWLTRLPTGVRRECSLQSHRGCSPTGPVSVLEGRSRGWTSWDFCPVL